MSYDLAELALDPEKDEIDAAIGKFVQEIAALELAVDEFIFAASQKDFFQNLMQKFEKTPMKMFTGTLPDFGSQKGLSKIDFLIECYLSWAPLRRSGDVDGQLNISSMALGIEEIWGFRNMLIHSRRWTIIKNDRGWYFEAERFQRVDAKSANRITTRVGCFWLLKMFRSSKYYRTQLRTGFEIIEGRTDWLQLDRQRKEIEKSRDFKNLIERLGIDWAIVDMRLTKQRACKQ